MSRSESVLSREERTHVSTANLRFLTFVRRSLLGHHPWATGRVQTPGYIPKKLKKTSKKTYPKFDPVSFLVLLITKDFIMFKAFNSTSSEFVK